MCTMKYTAEFVLLWAYIFAGGPGASCRDIAYTQNGHKNVCTRTEMCTDNVRMLLTVCTLVFFSFFFSWGSNDLNYFKLFSFL